MNEQRTIEQRVAFEKWMARRFPGASPERGEVSGEDFYFDQFTDGAWEAWRHLVGEIQRVIAEGKAINHSLPPVFSGFYEVGRK